MVATIGFDRAEDMERKYREEIHANEFVLLAYCIAAINIETVFHAASKRDAYLPFEGICLTDTFGLDEGDDELSLHEEQHGSAGAAESDGYPRHHR